MNYNVAITYYSIFASTVVGMLTNLSPTTNLWVIFTVGGIFITIGHQIFDKKIKNSFGKIIWNIVVSLVFCLLLKVLHDEGVMSKVSLIIYTLVVSMVAPATVSLALNELPKRISDQITAFPEWFVGLLKSKAESAIHSKQEDDDRRD